MAAAPNAGQSQLVGRYAELMALQHRLDEVRAGRGGIVLISGEPGVGKTRLLQEALARASVLGMLTLAGRAYESEAAASYLPFVEAFRSFIRGSPADRLSSLLGEGGSDVALVLRDLVRKLPNLARPPADGIERTGGRYHLFDAITDFVCEVAHEGSGLALALDDLHWADRPTLLLLLHMARRAATAPLLLLVGFRDTHVASDHPLVEMLAELRRDRLGTRLALEPLSHNETAALVAQTLSAAAPELVQSLHRRTGGNPFLLEEMIAAFGDLGGDRPARADAPGGVPAGVRDIVSQRLATLSAVARDAVQAGAVLGDGFSFELLAAMVDCEGARLIDAIEETLRASVLREEAGGYRFRHALLREAVEQGLTAPRRADLHRRAGEAYARLHAGNPAFAAATAEHFAAAGFAADAERAAAFARTAATHAAAMLAYEEEARSYELILRLGVTAGGEEECAVLLALADARRHAGEFDAAMATYERVVEQLRRMPSPALLARAALGYEEAFLPTGRPRLAGADPSAALLLEALAALDEEEGSLRARLLAARARALHFAGASDEPRLLIADAAVQARAIDDPAALAFTLDARRMITFASDSPSEREALADELCSAARNARDEELLFAGLALRLRALMERGETEKAKAELPAFARLAEQLRQPRFIGEALIWDTIFALYEGRFADARALLDRGLALAERTRSGDLLRQFLVKKIRLAYECGGDAELSEAEESARMLTRGIEGFVWDAPALFLSAARGRLEDARRMFGRAAAADFHGFEHTWIWLHALALLAESCAVLRDRRAAATLYRLLQPFARRAVFDPGGVGVLARHLGLLAVLLGDSSAARAHFELALDLNANSGARPALAHTRYAYGLLLSEQRERADRSRSRELLNAAAAEYAALGMAVWEQRARAALDGLGGPVGRAALPDGLTAREAEVLGLVAAGLSNEAIAARLVLSPRTVERHLTNSYGKIGARGRADATAYALRHELI